MHDNKKIINRLNIIKGQVEGIIRMVEDDRYCIDVSNQIMAVNSSLKSVNRDILTKHIHACVKESIENKENTHHKLEEVVTIIDKLGR